MFACAFIVCLTAMFAFLRRRKEIDLLCFFDLLLKTSIVITMMSMVDKYDYFIGKPLVLLFLVILFFEMDKRCFYDLFGVPLIYFLYFLIGKSSQQASERAREPFCEKFWKIPIGGLGLFFIAGAARLLE